MQIEVMGSLVIEHNTTEGYYKAEWCPSGTQRFQGVHACGISLAFLFEDLGRNVERYMFKKGWDSLCHNPST